MSDQPLISIPLCTYQGARYLREQLDSLLAQTYRPLEIVAVDDASQDDTVAILKEYARRHASMRVEVNASNLGFTRNFERALSLCRGEYIAPCDQDDVWLPDKLTIMRSQIGNSLLAYCDSALMDADGQLLHRAMSDTWRMPDVQDPAAFVFENNISGHAMLFKRELLTRALPVPGGFFHDWWLAALAASITGVKYCPQPLVHYRQHVANVTRKIVDAAQPTGFGWRKLQETGDRISCLAQLPGTSQALLIELDILWRVRNRQWLSVGLAWWIARHYKRVFLLKKRSWSSRWRLPFKYLPGMRLKRLLSAHKYAHANAS